MSDTYVDGFLIVPLRLLIFVMTNRSEKRKSALSFRVPWFEAMVTISWRTKDLNEKNNDSIVISSPESKFSVGNSLVDFNILWKMSRNEKFNLPVFGNDARESINQRLDFAQYRLLLLPLEDLTFRTIDFDNKFVNFFLSCCQEIMIRMRRIGVFQKSLNEKLVSWNFLYRFNEQLIKPEFPSVLTFQSL